MLDSPVEKRRSMTKTKKDLQELKMKMNTTTHTNIMVEIDELDEWILFTMDGDYPFIESIMKLLQEFCKSQKIMILKHSAG